MVNMNRSVSNSVFVTVPNCVPMDQTVWSIDTQFGTVANTDTATHINRQTVFQFFKISR